MDQPQFNIVPPSLAQPLKRKRDCRGIDVRDLAKVHYPRSPPKVIFDRIDQVRDGAEGDRPLQDE
jgi:hypothetical protein